MKAGVPYSMVNTVIEFEPNRRIAWQTRPPGVFGKLFGGRIWRYELEPADGGTLVRETWDITRGARQAAGARRREAHARSRWSRRWSASTPSWRDEGDARRRSVTGSERVRRIYACLLELADATGRDPLAARAVTKRWVGAHHGGWPAGRGRPLGADP